MKLLPVIKNHLPAPPANSPPATREPVIIDIKARVVKDKDHNQVIADGIYVSLWQIISFGAVAFALGFLLALSTAHLTNVSTLLFISIGGIMFLIGFLVGRYKQ